MEKLAGWDLEEVLVRLDIGKYQYYILILLGLTLAYSNVTTLSFVFTAADIDYRCEIAQCENDRYQHKVAWLPISGHHSQIGKCVTYPLKEEVFTGNSTVICTNDSFDTFAKPIPCRSWVYSDTVTSIVSSFNVTCNQENLLIVGTINNIGIVVGLPFMSYFADRYGRKISLICSCILTAIFGTLRSYSSSLNFFLITEFFGSVFNSGIYPIAFILGMELVSSTKRPLTGMIIGNFYPLGAVVMGVMMWWLRDWRLMLQMLYLPGILFVFYIWLIPESMRWLQTKGRRREEALILLKIAKINGKQLPENITQFVTSTRETEYSHSTKKQQDKEFESVSISQSFKTIFSSRQIVLRVIFCSYCWIAIFLVFYGLSLTSVSLPIGNKYLNFILSNFMEIPAALLTVPIMEKTGRRISQCVLFLLTAVSCLTCNFISNDLGWLTFTLSMLSKLLISILSIIIYVYTTEIFPTELRMSLHGLCSTFGRIGSMLAPQTPLLETYYGENASILLFGSVSIIGAIAILFLPETKDIILPDTLKEAVNVDSEYENIP